MKVFAIVKHDLVDQFNDPDILGYCTKKKEAKEKAADLEQKYWKEVDDWVNGGKMMMPTASINVVELRRL